MIASLWAMAALAAPSPARSRRAHRMAPYPPAAASFVPPTRVSSRKYAGGNFQRDVLRPSEAIEGAAPSASENADCGERRRRGGRGEGGGGEERGTAARGDPGSDASGRRRSDEGVLTKPAMRKRGRPKGETAAGETRAAPVIGEGNAHIRFSRVFQRHVVYRRHGDGGNEAVRSFEFLDEAMEFFPGARVLAPRDLPFPPPLCSVDDGGGGKAGVEEEECESSIAGMGLWSACDLEYDDDGPGDADRRRGAADDALRELLRLVSSSSTSTVPRHFFRLHSRRFAARGHTPESVSSNHSRMVRLLSSGGGGDFGLAMGPSDVEFVLQNFPQLCLYDCGELEGMLRFLLRPLPPGAAGIAGRGGAEVDWPCLAGRGYGAGLTIDQATKAMRLMPELMALYYEDSRKPSMVYMCSQTQATVPPKLMDEAVARLDLEGADPADAYTFAYLHSLGISWAQLRILASGLPLWTTSNLDPGWELLSSGPVRSMLKRPALDYLRQRLQIGPGDVYRLLRTHTRLSTYNARNKILPVLDGLQSKLGLPSAGLRKLILRMPSLMGMGMSALDARLDFFVDEAGMSIDDLREAAMKQPSLLQYGISSTLRPKLHFFLHELGTPRASICRIIRSAPSVMGLSLTENLRPKAASIMRMCALGPHEMGRIVSTAPQTLQLSRKGKIEPTLRFLASALALDEPWELGEIVARAPRALAHGQETSLARKFGLLADRAKPKSRDAAIAMIRRNPALLTCSYAVLEDRCDRCPEDTDISTWLLPSNKGRRKSFPQLLTTPEGDSPILESPDEVASFDRLTRIYSSAKAAAEELDAPEWVVREACGNGTPIDGKYLYSPGDFWSGLPDAGARPAKVVPVSLFCSGAPYPSDDAGVARGRSRTGGLSIQAFTDESSHDKRRFLRDFAAAAESCFGICVPVGEHRDESKSIAVFPLVNPSRNRCELFSCSSALRILEAFLRSRGDEGDTSYDIKIYTDSDYAWKLVRSDRLLKLGSYSTSHEMMANLEMPGYSVNVDILHPLARSFSRLNGLAESLESTHRRFKNAKVRFIHSMDGIGLIDGGLAYVKRLRREARSAAMWQFNRERKLI